MLFPYPSISPQSKQFLSKAFIQQNILNAWKICEENPQYAAPNLAQWFRQNRSLGSRDRKIVAEVLYTLIRFEKWFVYHQYPAILDRCTFLSQIDAPTLPSVSDQTEVALEMHLSIPDWMAKQWSLQLGREAPIFCSHLQQRAPLDIRCNLLKITRSQLQHKLQQRNIETEIIPNTTAGLRLLGSANLQNDPLFQQGLFEIQDASSQYFCESIDLQPQDLVLDFCAGAGGKALALASRGAKVWVHEPRSHALNELQKRAKRANVNFQYGLPQMTSQKRPPKLMDIVVVDAPCSGSGRLRREPTIRWKWQFEDPLQWVNLQQELLEQATHYVKDTGIIAYATCSLLKEENNHILDGWDCERHLLWPHQWNCDGFSWSIYRKRN